MNLIAMDIADRRRKLQTTVLHRPGGAWQQWEIGRFVSDLKTEATQHLLHPEYVILFGHHTKERTLLAHGGGIAYTATQVIGIDSPKLPFVPGF